MADSRRIYLMNGFVDINPYDNNGNLIYKIKYPVEINNGYWGCKIIFFKDKNLLYHNSSAVALNISLTDNKLEFVYFSKDYNMILFYEKNNKNYILKIINYKDEEIFELNRLNSKINLKSFISEFIESNYLENMNLMKNFEFKKTIFMKNHFIKNIFNRWFPEHFLWWW